MNIQLVPHTHIDIVWPVVGPMLAKACTEKASCGEFTTDQVRMAIVEKHRHLFIAVEDEKIEGAATVEFINYPNMRAAFIGSLGGKGIVTEQMFNAVKEWCKEMGASEIRAYVKGPQARLYSRVGMEPIYYVVGAKI